MRAIWFKLTFKSRVIQFKKELLSGPLFLVSIMCNRRLNNRAAWQARQRCLNEQHSAALSKKKR